MLYFFLQTVLNMHMHVIVKDYEGLYGDVYLYEDVINATVSNSMLPILNQIHNYALRRLL